MPKESQVPLLSIVPAVQKEMSHIIMLAHRIWPVAYKDILTPEQIQNILRSIYTHENLEKEKSEGHQFWVAYVDGLPVGYASMYAENDIIWIKKLYVDPSVKGRRIGARLMHTGVSPFLPAKEIRLLVNSNNTPAQGFYTHMGFHKLGEIPVQMGDFQFTDFMYSMPLTEK